MCLCASASVSPWPSTDQTPMLRGAKGSMCAAGRGRWSSRQCHRRPGEITPARFCNCSWPQRSTTNSYAQTGYLWGWGKNLLKKNVHLFHKTWSTVNIATTSAHKHTQTYSFAHHAETRHRKVNQEIRREHIPHEHSGGLICTTTFRGFINESTLGLTQDTGAVRGVADTITHGRDFSFCH